MTGQPPGGPLAEARRHWGGAYDLWDPGPGPDGDGFRAVRRDGLGAVTAPHPAGLWDAMARDSAATPVVASGQDQAVLLRAFLTACPGAEAWFWRRSWFGAVPAGEDRWLWTGQAGTDLAGLLDLLDVLARVAAACQAVEADHPGWQCRLSAGGMWRASRPGQGAPLTVTAPSAASLREKIAAAPLGLAS